jgi:hypothetical protein
VTFGDPQITICLKVRPKGRAPSKYGPGAYKFPRQVARLLIARNWQDVGQGLRHSYLKPPESHPGDQPFAINVCIPSRAQVLNSAQQLHTGGVKWIGRWGEWEVGYRPANNDEFFWSEQTVNPFTATPVGSPTRHKSSYSIEPLFIIGIVGLWTASVRWTNGEFAYQEDSRNLMHEHLSLFDSTSVATPIPADLVGEAFIEGALHRVSTNRYERDDCARRACIAHFGASCCICHFDFGKTYGNLALGFIHVHHIVPLSSVGEEYTVDPIKDLIPVCPNCHAVFHLSDPPHTFDEVKKFLRQ